MAYNSPLGKWSFFETEDSEFEHGFSNTNHRAIIAALQQSSFYYYHESDKKEHKELLSGSTYPAYYWVKNDDGERQLALAIYLNNQKSGFVDLNFDINLVKLNGQSVTYYIPFANQTGPSGGWQYAIKVFSKNVYDFLVFVQVTFLDVYSALFEKLRKHILDEIDLNINEPSVIIDWYNLLPIEMLATFSKEKRLIHLQAILNKSNLFNKAELAILKLLKSFNPTNAALPVENSKEALEQTYATYILKKLVDTKSKKVTFLERLYDAVNGDNFNELLQTLTSLWRNSSFMFSDHADYNVYTQQVNIPYTTSKSWGFNITNFSFVFKGGQIEATQTIILLVKEEPDDSVSEEELEELGENEPTYKRVAVEKPFGKFHVYQPLTFLPLKDDEIGPPEYFMPAFFLKATDDQKMWQNQLRLAYLTFNLASVFIGAGVILRFGQVFALVRAAQTAEAVLITVGSIQVVAGTADFFLTLTEDEPFQKQNPALYQSIRNWLLVVELASFAVEVISAKMLIKASEDVLANATDAIRKDQRWAEAEADLQRTARGETAADATAKLVELTEKELKQLIGNTVILRRIHRLKNLKIYKSKNLYVLQHEGITLYKSSDVGFPKLIDITLGDATRLEKRLAEMTTRARRIPERKALMKEWLDVGQGKATKYRDHEIDTLCEAEVIYNTELRALQNNKEAGDAIATTGIFKGKSFDAIGTPDGAFKEIRWQKRYKKSLKELTNSIDRHFKKIHTPDAGQKPLDKIVFDFKNYDENFPNLRKEVMEYIEKNYSSYISKGQIIFIN